MNVSRTMVRECGREIITCMEKRSSASGEVLRDC